MRQSLARLTFPHVAKYMTYSYCANRLQLLFLSCACNAVIMERHCLGAIHTACGAGARYLGT